MDGDENSAQDMRNYLGAAERIMREFGCTVIIVHHCGVNGERPRGSTAIDGSLDALIRIAKNEEDDTITAIVEQAKEMKPGFAVLSKIENRYIGIDADGEEYFSCIVTAPDGGNGIANKDAIGQFADKKKGKTEKRNVALELLKKLIAEQGKSFTPDADASKGKVLAVSEKDWLARYRAKMADADTKPESIDRSFRRDKNKLIESKVIDTYGGQVWLVSDERGGKQ
jgi:hypothetical protein